MPNPQAESSKEQPYRHLIQAEREKFTKLSETELILIALSTIIAELLPRSPYNSALRLELLDRAFARVKEEKKGKK